MKHARRIPVVAIEEDCYVNVDDITVLQRPVVWDAVADALVYCIGLRFTDLV